MKSQLPSFFLLILLQQAILTDQATCNQVITDSVWF